MTAPAAPPLTLYPPAELRSQGRWSRAARLARKKPVGLIAAIVVLTMALTAAAAPLVATHDPLATGPGQQLKAPSAQHFFGTDKIGRDVFSRVVYGARVSLLVSVTSVLIGVTSGTLIGATIAYIGGILDLVFQRWIDALMALPGIMVALALVSALGRKPEFIAIAIAIGIFPRVVRVARSVTLTVRREPYVEAAVSIGSQTSRVVLRHVLPNIFAPILIVATTSLGSAIIIESSLGFLGLGTQPPQPSWGNLIGGQARFELERAPWLIWAPGLAISLTVLSYNLLGDALRDILDPRLRGS